MTDCYIYALVDPRTGEDFYVGSTINPEKRLVSHVNEKHTNGPNWERINQIREANETLKMRILEVTSIDERMAREQTWIDRLRNDGAILSNIKSPMPELSLWKSLEIVAFEKQGNLWYISGSNDEGHILATPTVELEGDAMILSDGIARLKNSEVDAARRWVVMAGNGEEAVGKLARFCLGDPEESLPALALETGVGYDTLVRYAREGRVLARKSGGVWFSTRRAVEAAGIKPWRK